MSNATAKPSTMSNENTLRFITIEVLVTFLRKESFSSVL